MADWEDAPTAATAKPGGGWEDAPSKVTTFMKGQTAEAVPWYERAWQGLKQGAKDTVYAAAQIGARMPEEGVDLNPVEAEKQRQERAATVDRVIKTDDQDYQKQRAAEGTTGFDWWRLGGNVASTAPLSILTGSLGGVTTLGRLGAAALGGAAGGALTPVTQGDFATEKAKQIGMGAASGGTAGAGGEIVSKAAAPAFNAAKKLLIDEGVRLTPGQMAGGIARTAEDKATSVPITGDAISYGRRAGIKDFNIAAYNRALKPIGEKYDGKDVGYEGIKAVREKISAAYDKALSGTTFRATPKFDADLNSLRTLVNEMPPDQVKQFENILANRVTGRMPTGTMDGKTFKQVESELTNLSSGYHASADWKERQFGDALDELNAVMRRNLADTNPGKADELAKANQAWAAFARVRRAAVNRTKSDGVFTPSDLLTALKTSDKSPGKSVFSQGDAVMQDLARAGNEVLPSTIPDSGTTGRALLAGGALEGAHFFNHPEVIAGLGAVGVPYLPGSLSALRQWAQPGPTRNALAGLMQRLAPTAAPSLGASASALAPAAGAAVGP